MATNTEASKILENEFLPVRAKLLEAAAALDRLDRAPGSTDDDPRVLQIRQAIEILLSQRENRAEQLQMIFSLPYDAAWRDKFFG